MSSNSEMGHAASAATRREEARLKRKTKIVLLSLAIAGVMAIVGGVGTIVGVFWWYGRGVAELDEARLKDYRPPLVTRIYAREGELIGELFSQRRTLIGYQDIPSHVENAFLAAEDADFYQHEGMDYMGMARALLANLKAGRVRQGASTITQQVVKIFMLSPERSFERKVQELILARRLEKAFTKKEILELYLNEIYLGHGRYGIEEASLYYFAKSVRALDLGQAALLATLPKAPGRDSPIKNPKRAKERQQYVLQQMVKHGFVGASEIAPYLDAGLALAGATERLTIQAGAEEFVDEVERELEAAYGDEGLETLGAEVTTTVSLPAQRAARAALIENLRAVDVRNGYGHRLKPATPAQRAERLAGSPQDVSELEVGKVVEFVVAEPPSALILPPDTFLAQRGAVTAIVPVEPGSRYREAEVDLATQFPVGALVRVRIVAAPGKSTIEGARLEWAEGQLDVGPQAAAFVIDVATGDVEVMVGGTQPRRSEFNRILQAKRQPGSSFKPFVYGAALRSGGMTAATLISDSPEIYEKWRPTNFEADKYLGDVRLRVALTKSINTVAIKLVDRVGVEAVHEFAKLAGIETVLPSNLSVALGTGEVTPFELGRAYLTLARGGSRIEPVFIRSVRVTRGEPWAPSRTNEQVLSPEVVFVLTSMMQSVVEEGTGTAAKALGRPAAGKTGTSADFHDAWFAGFTPDHVGIAWVGFDQPRRLGRKETGGKAAVPLWVEVMKLAETGPAKGFLPPGSVSVRRIDAVSGLLAPTGEDAEAGPMKVLEEYFVVGTEPVDEATPAALPATDVLLDLYDASAVYDASAIAPGGEAATPPSDASAVPVAAPGLTPTGLPSLDDD